MKLKAGIPLVTKNSQALSNAVLYKVIEGKHRDTIWVLSDFGNIMKFPSEETVLECYDISENYLDTVAMMNEYGMGQEWLDGQFNIRDRLQHQIELLTEALEGLE